MRTLLVDVQRGLKEGLADASKVAGASDPKVIAYSCTCPMIPEVCGVWGVCAECEQLLIFECTSSVMKETLLNKCAWM